MNILTNRCKIRPFIPDDINSFASYHNNLDWMRYQGCKGLSKEIYSTELLNNASLSKGRQFAIADKSTNKLIGDIYLYFPSS